MLRTRLLRWLCLSAAVAAICAGVSAPALARAAAIPKVVITAAVDAAGTLAVREDRTYQFAGAVTSGTQEIEVPPRSVLRDLTFGDNAGPYALAAGGAPGTYEVQPVPGAPGVTRVRWYFGADERERTFTLRYRLTNVYRLHQDAVELQWDAVSSRWGLDQADVQVRVSFPAQPLQAWLERGVGTVSVGEGVVEVRARDLGTGKPLTLRAILRPDAITQAGVRDDLTLAQLLAGAKPPRPRWPGQAALLLAALAGAAFALRHVLPRPITSSYRPGPQPPPGLRPAQAAAFLGSTVASTLLAGALDLVRRGVLRATPLPDAGGAAVDWLLARGDGATTALDEALLQVLLPDARADVPLSHWPDDLRVSRAAQAASVEWYRRLRNSLPREWPAPHLGWPYLLAATLLGTGSWDPYVRPLLFTAGAVLALLGLLQHRLTPAGSNAAADWEAYRRWLQQHQPLPGRTPADLGDPLVYAVAFDLVVLPLSQPSAESAPLP